MTVKNGLKWAKMTQKWYKKGLQNGIKMTPKRAQNDAKMILSDHKMTPDRPRNHFDPFWPVLGPYDPFLFLAPKRSKMVKKQKVTKNRSKVIWTFIKVHKTLKIHSGYFQTHPLTAHFHRLKRRS